MPFEEPGAQEVLRARRRSPGRRARRRRRRRPTHIVLTLGTPSFSHIEIDMRDIRSVLDDLLPLLRPGHSLVLRSTIAPRTTEFVAGYIEQAPRLRGRRATSSSPTSPSASRPGASSRRSRRCRASSAASARARARSPRELFEPLGAPIVQTSPVAGRAGQDLDEHPALRDVRAAQPADDGLRAVRRERLRRHRARSTATTRAAASRAGLHRRDVPAQGLRLLRGALARAGHAAGGLARQRVRPAVPRRGHQAPPRLAARARRSRSSAWPSRPTPTTSATRCRTSSSACSSASSPTSPSTTRTSRRRRSPSTRRCWTPTPSSSRPTTPSSAAASAAPRSPTARKARRARGRPVELLGRRPGLRTRG